MRLLTISAILLALVSRPLTAQWTEATGIYGGTIHDISNSSGDTVFCSSDDFSIFRSVDGGQTWSNMNQTKTINAKTNTIRIVGSNVFACTDSGVYVSADRGLTWQVRNTGLPDGIAVEIADSAAVLLLIIHPRFSDGSGELYKSTNSGLNWYSSSNGLPSFCQTISRNGSNWYVGQYGKVYTSTDAGSNWVNQSSGLPTLTYVSDFGFVGGAVFVSFDGGGVYKSTNSGASWVEVNIGLSSLYVESISAGTTLFAATYDGIFRSTDAGASWVTANSGFRGFDPKVIKRDGSTLLTGSYTGGIYRSTDLGVSWQHSSAGIYFPYVTSVILDSSTGYCAVRGTGVMKSTNNGLSWFPINNGISRGEVVALAKHKNDIYAASEREGVLRSTNQGTSWFTSNAGLPSVYLSNIASSGDKLFATGYYYGVYSLNELNQTWTTVVLNLAVDWISAEANRIIISGVQERGTRTEFLATSTDAGQTWPLAPGRYRVLVKDSTFYRSPLSKSIDGINWTTINGTGGGSIHIVDTYFFLSDDAEFYVSSDVGVTLRPKGWSGRGVITAITSNDCTLVISSYRPEYDSYGNSKSGIFRYDMGKLPPSSPTSLQGISVTSKQIDLSWVASKYGSPYRYRIFRSTSSSNFSQIDSVSGTSFSDGGLTEDTRYYYFVQAVNDSGTTPSSVISVIAEAVPGIPTISNATGYSDSSIQLSWNASGTGGLPLRYRVLRSVSSNGVYTQVDSVIHPNQSSIDSVGLSSGTYYFYKIQSVNAAGASYASSEISATTFAGPPTAVLANMQFSNISANSLRLSYSPSSGTAEGYVVVRSIGAVTSLFLTNGTTYSIGQSVKSMTDTVVYIGDSTAIAIDGLAANNDYFFYVFPFNGSGASTNYASSAASAHTYTLVTEPGFQPTALIFSLVGSSTVTLAFTGAVGLPNGYLVLRRDGGAPSSAPSDGMSYSNGDSIGDGVVSLIGNFTTFVDTGLTPATTTHFAIFSYNGSGAQVNYLSSNPLRGSVTTLSVEPISQPVNLVIAPSLSSLGISLSAGNNSPSGYVTLRRAGLPVTAIPIDGQFYSRSDVVGDGTIAHTGPELNFVDSNLVSGQTYHYSIFAYNGSGATTNYLTTNPLTGSQSTAQDNIAPQITSSSANPNPVTVGNAIQLSATITDNNAVNAATLEYRSGTQAAFGNSQSMTASGNTYSATIPGSAVGASGIFYRIIAADGQNNRDTLIGSVGVSVPVNSVSTQNTSGGSYTSGFPDGAWRMISVPLNLDDDAASTVLADFGAPGDKTWKMFSKTTDVSSNGQFTIGKAFWLKQIHIPGGKQITLGSGTTASLTDGQITLQPGWNQIGNPFTFAIDWNTDTDADQNSNIKGPVKYDGNKYIGIGQVDAPNDPTPFTQLLPWDGYWVYNASSSPVVLTIDPSGSLSKSMVKRAMLDWRMEFAVHSGTKADEWNVIGEAVDALDGEDRHDMPELPVIGEYVSVWFDREDGAQTIDVRQKNGEGHVWTMHAKTNVRSKESLLEYAGELPSGYVMRILDVSNNREVTRSGETVRNRVEMETVFKVFIGTAEYVDAEFAKAKAELPSEFRLSQNYPNPFNPVTTIRYELARTSKVTLEIYNTLGQKVRTLVSGVLATGVYDVTWDGRSETGARIASGVYFYRLNADGVVRTRKMLLVK